MKISKPAFDLIYQFNLNWTTNQKTLIIDLSDEEVINVETHPLKGELSTLINGQGASLPYFVEDKVIWCTLAPEPVQLHKLVSSLQAWILPSFGWQESIDGYKVPNVSGDAFQKAIAGYSPFNYFRWRSFAHQYPLIEHKLAVKFELERKRPERGYRGHPSLYELRTQFYTALMLGGF